MAFFLRGKRRLLALGSAAVLGLAACQATEPVGIPATDEHRALFPGTYATTIAGDAEVSLTVAPDLQYEFKQPLAKYKIKAIKGTLAVTGDKTARAGRVRLEWVGRNAVAVKSPFGTSMTSGGAAGSPVGQWGAEYMLRRQ